MRSLGRPRYRWKVNIKIDYKMDYRLRLCTGLMRLRLGTSRSTCEQGAEPCSSIQSREFIDMLMNC
jgi:hypothetical protein